MAKWPFSLKKRMDNASSIFEDARDGGESGRARSFGRQDNGGPFKSEGQGVFEDPVTHLLLRDALVFVPQTLDPGLVRFGLVGHEQGPV